MAADAGEQAPGDAWLDDASPRHSAPRANGHHPLDPSRQAWVYVYRSQTLSTVSTPTTELRCGAHPAHQRSL
jgi:hypothetical protein